MATATVNRAEIAYDEGTADAAISLDHNTAITAFLANLRG